MENDSKRSYHLDILRIISILSVLLLHAAGHTSSYFKNDPKTFDYQFPNVFDSVTRYCVPIFVMISGALFLTPDKKINIKVFFKKNIFRLLVAFVFWSFLYTLVFSTLKYNSTFSAAVAKDAIMGTLKGGMYHLWYIPMTIGLYLILPVLKQLVTNISQKLLEYFIISLIFFSILLPSLNLIPFFNSTFTFISKNLSLGFSISEYITYFIVGYYLNSFPIKPFIKKTIYILSILSAIFTAAGTGLISYIKSEEYVLLREYYTLNVFLLSCGLFLFIKKIFENHSFSNRAQKIIIYLSKNSFGVYLAHIFVLELIMWLLPINYSPLALLSYFVVSVIGSYIITHIISKIKFINKYII